MIEIPALEYHVTHGCNLSCRQCSHYSNFHLDGPMSTPEEYAAWSRRLRPRRFALLGGEPALNPRLVEHVQLARRSWPDSELMLVSNGFLLHRHSELPRVLIETNCRLEVSRHGTSVEYMKKFAQVKRLLGRWRAAYPGIQIRHRRHPRMATLPRLPVLPADGQRY